MSERQTRAGGTLGGFTFLCGSKPGVSFSIRVAGDHACVRTVLKRETRSEKSVRCFLISLVAGAPSNRVALGPFSVEGRFVVVAKVNNPKQALAVWELFKASPEKAFAFVDEHADNASILTRIAVRERDGR